MGKRLERGIAVITLYTVPKLADFGFCYNLGLFLNSYLTCDGIFWIENCQKYRKFFPETILKVILKKAHVNMIPTG